jgi:hypothetical protein
MLSPKNYASTNGQFSIIHSAFILFIAYIIHLAATLVIVNDMYMLFLQIIYSL